MDDKELANKIVAHGVYGKSAHGAMFCITHLGTKIYVSAEQFVRDGRVAMALMEKCYENEIDISTHTGLAAHNGKNWVGLTSDDEDWTADINESLSRAINEVCAEALSD